MTQRTEGRFWVKLISSDALAQYMQHRAETVRSLAAQVDLETARASVRSGVPGTSSRAIIGLLRSGKRNTCRPTTAAAIEKCLGAPKGSLFVPQVSHVSRVTRSAVADRRTAA